MMRLKIGVIAAFAALFVAAGCGGSASHQTAAVGGGASVAPASAVAYVSVDSNLDSAAWTRAKALLDRFPGKDELIANLRSSLRQEGLDWETDVKPALGDEVDAVWLDFQNNGDNVIGLTKPKDAAKFNALLAKAKKPPVHEEVDGWTVFAESRALLDRFDKARSDSGSLADDSTFSDHSGDLSADSIAAAWVRGSAAQTAFDRRLNASGLPAGATKKQFGTLDALTAAVTPGSDGIKLAATFSGDLDAGVSSYHAELPGAVPAGAIFYLSVNNIGDNLRKLLDSVPNFDQQRAQIELALGYPLDDVFALLSGEAGLAVYPNEGGTPGVLLAAKVNNETKAQNILNRLVTLAALSGRFHAQTVQIGAVQAKEIKLSDAMSAYAAVFDGNLVTTNSRKLIEDMQGAGPKLSDDSAYQAALTGARVPQDTNGFLYADLKETIEYVIPYVEVQGGTVPQTVKDNTAPLRGLLVYVSKDGGGYTLTGFLGIQ
jgi:Protein of unknown function (DUF3352)